MCMCQLDCQVVSELYLENRWPAKNDPLSPEEKHSQVFSFSQVSMPRKIKTYSNHLNTGLVRYSDGMVRYSNDGLKTGLKKAWLWSKMSGI